MPFIAEIHLVSNLGWWNSIVSKKVTKWLKFALIFHKGLEESVNLKLTLCSLKSTEGNTNMSTDYRDPQLNLHVSLVIIHYKHDILEVNRDGWQMNHAWQSDEVETTTFKLKSVLEIPYDKASFVNGVTGPGGWLWWLVSGTAGKSAR